MLVDYDYITKIEHGPFKLELYDTGERGFLWIRKVYAYQLFQDNRLIFEDHCVTSKDPVKLLGGALKALESNEIKKLDYVEEFLPISS